MAAQDLAYQVRGMTLTTTATSSATAGIDNNNDDHGYLPPSGGGVGGGGGDVDDPPGVEEGTEPDTSTLLASLASSSGTIHRYTLLLDLLRIFNLP